MVTSKQLASGAIVSLTVTAPVQLDTLPDWSVRVINTLIGAQDLQLKSVRLMVRLTMLQLSVLLPLIEHVYFRKPLNIRDK
ncbi:MAG: hypothetical protein R2778_13925 [Saprospiraceae bacterium]